MLSAGAGTGSGAGPGAKTGDRTAGGVLAPRTGTVTELGRAHKLSINRLESRMDEIAPPAAPARIATSALVSFALGVAALAMLFAGPFTAAAVGIAAIAVSLVSRRRLIADPALAGSRVSLLGFVFGAIAVAVGGLPIVLVTLLSIM